MATEGGIRTWPHYENVPIRTMVEVRQVFPKGVADSLNWLVCSTSGVHGSYDTITDVAEAIQRGEDGHITVLIIQPRLCVLRYGQVPVTLDDLVWLRGVVRSTLAVIAESQEGNT